jgi:hypothetical protein
MREWLHVSLNSSRSPSRCPNNNLVHTPRGLLADTLDGASPDVHHAGSNYAASDTQRRRRGRGGRQITGSGIHFHSASGLLRFAQRRERVAGVEYAQTKRALEGDSACLRKG